MERLTVRESASYDLIKMNDKWCVDYCKEQPIQTCRDCAIYEAMQKLAYYEDLEEQGRLPILYIGYDVYFRVKGMNQLGENVDFIQTQKISRIDIDPNGILYCTASVKFIIGDVGKSVFLTREEAELKLMEGENKL